MKTKTTLLGIISIITLTQSLVAKAPVDQPTVDTPAANHKVQIALLLDTSNSMDGLIDQAKSQLWKVVNTFIDARRDGEAPFVEVALYEYGNNNQSARSQYIRQVQPLTRDLDEVSKQLNALSTNGGEEYCGAVIQRAITDLKWDQDAKTYKAIFIAGNEEFTQGSVDVRDACKEGFSKGVIINTIHCGPRDEGISGSWHDGAALANGDFMIIDQDRAVCHIVAPQDQKISDLGLELNKTYLGYGVHFKAGVAKQRQADEAAALESEAGAAVERAISKSSRNYHNSGWDLVDAVREKKVDLSKLPASELPAELKNLKPEEIQQRVDEAARKRLEIQSQINTLNAERTAFVEAEQQKQAKSGDKTLDQVMVETTRKQAIKLGYTFEN